MFFKRKEKTSVHGFDVTPSSENKNPFEETGKSDGQSTSANVSLDELKGDPEILNLLVEGKKTKAIQIVRAKTGVDLRTAKEFVEGL